MNNVRRIPPKEYINSYWCPDCGKLVNITYHNSSIKFEIECDEDIELVTASVDFDIVCNNCDSYMIPIDYLISKQIKALNDMGCKTMYCCAGHLNAAPKLDNASDVYKQPLLI